MPLQCVDHIRIGEQRLYAGLRIVEIAPQRAYANIGALLRHHLEALHLADALAGIEHQDLRIRYIPEPLQRRLAGIAGGGHQNDDLFAGRRLLHRRAHEMRQNLQRHVLEGAGGTVPQLQHMHPVAKGMQRSDGRGVELSAVCAVGAGGDFLSGKVRQKQRQDPLRPLGIGQGQQFLQERRIHGGQLRRHEQAALRRDASGDGLRGRYTDLMVSGA